MQQTPRDQKQPIVLYGAGGHAKSVISVLERESKWEVVGLLDDNPATDSVLGYPVLGDRGRARSLLESGITRVHVSVGDNAARSRLAAEMVSLRFSLGSVVDPTAVRFTETSIGRGALVHAYTVLGAACQLGELAIVNVHAAIGHDSVIGDSVQLAPFVCLAGNVTVGDRSFVGMGAMVLPGVAVGSDVVVGANSVVTSDVEDNAIVVGAPARPVKSAAS